MFTGELATSIRKRTSMKFGVYHSLFEWYNPMFEADRKNGFKTRDYVEVGGPLHQVPGYSRWMLFHRALIMNHCVHPIGKIIIDQLLIGQIYNVILIKKILKKLK